MKGSESARPSFARPRRRQLPPLSALAITFSSVPRPSPALWLELAISAVCMHPQRAEYCTTQRSMLSPPAACSPSTAPPTSWRDNPHSDRMIRISCTGLCRTPRGGAAIGAQGPRLLPAALCCQTTLSGPDNAHCVRARPATGGLVHPSSSLLPPHRGRNSSLFPRKHNVSISDCTLLFAITPYAVVALLLRPTPVRAVNPRLPTPLQSLLHTAAQHPCSPAPHPGTHAPLSPTFARRLRARITL